MKRLLGAAAWQVRVPLLEEWASSPEFGRHGHPQEDRLVVRLTSEGGHQGWGEMIMPSPGLVADALPRLLATAWEAVPQSLLPLWKPDELYWSRPHGHPEHGPDMGELRHRLRHPLQNAVETALADLRARTLDVPFHQLYGGAWREWVPVDYWMGRVTPEHAQRCARRAVSLGFKGLKLKTTLQDPNVERLEAIRDAVGPEFSVTVDPNGRFYRLDDAWRVIAAMEGVGNMAILEDPFPRFHLGEFAALRRRIQARVVVHVDPTESIWAVLQSGAAGGLNLDSYVVGPAQWRLDAGMAERANLAVWHGAGQDLGIATAAQLHLAASAPNCKLPGDQASPWLREHTLLKAAFEVRDGCVRVPPGPGLGAEVDHDALERYAVGHWAAEA